MALEYEPTLRLGARRPPVARLIVVPAIITFGVTLLRLAGELLRWSPRFFSREAGGGAAVVGIVWLVPVFAIYFALKLIHMGMGPRRVGSAIGWAVLALIVSFVPAPLVGLLHLSSLVFIPLFGVAAVVAILIAWRGWPELGRTLLAYGLAVRVPVALIMLVAMLGGWGTHYDKGPPDFPAMGVVATWVWIGLLPQLTLWIGFTVVAGALFGGLAAAVALRGQAPATA